VAEGGIAAAFRRSLVFVSRSWIISFWDYPALAAEGFCAWRRTADSGILHHRPLPMQAHPMWSLRFWTALSILPMQLIDRLKWWEQALVAAEGRRRLS